MNNNILFTHPILGDITYKDMIDELKIIINDNRYFENIILSILREQNISDECISTILSYSIVNRLEWLLFLLQSSIEK